MTLELERIDIIGSNGNDGEHYEQPARPEQKPADYQYTDNTQWFGEDVR